MHIVHELKYSYCTQMYGCCTFFSLKSTSSVQVDLTEYVEKHGFFFDAVLDEDVSNDEVSI